MRKGDRVLRNVVAFGSILVLAFRGATAYLSRLLELSEATFRITGAIVRGLLAANFALGVALNLLGRRKDKTKEPYFPALRTLRNTT